MYKTLRPLIYTLTPEQAHHVTIAMLRAAGALPPARALLRRVFASKNPGPPVRAFGLDFPNPLGMAAGYDKDGLGWRGLACLGFGHIEVGTVTPRPQPGNPQPRLFRLVEDRAVINRMGFNNLGADFLARRLRGPMPADLRRQGVVIGVNIGKNKTTSLESAAEDYLSLLRDFAPLCGYLAVNISSPNTPGLRALQQRAALEGLLRPLGEEKIRLSHSLGRPVPVLVKLAPDLEDAELEDALCATLDAGMDGVIVTNTTVRRPPLRSPHAGETGGLSGAPLAAVSLEATRKTARMLNGRLPIVASGGVMTAADAQARLDAGATLVQLYTGLIYEGPGLVKQILDAGLRLKAS
jgi:dihydroorotate dehydrogenase